MSDFYKAAGFVLISVIVCLSLSGHSKHFPALITMVACAMIAMVAMRYFQPVLDFFKELQAMGNWNSEMFSILLKTTGINIVTEIVSNQCSDSGNAALSKALRLLSSAITLWLSLPIFSELLKLVNELLGKI